MMTCSSATFCFDTRKPFDTPILPLRPESAAATLYASGKRADGYAGGMRVAVRQVALACCALEVSTALHGSRPDLPGIVWDDDDPELTVLVLAGTVTPAAQPKIEAATALITGPSRTVAYGVCVSSGGPYWDSDAIVTHTPADVFVPGCPPRPEALWGAVQLAVEQVSS